MITMIKKEAVAAGYRALTHRYYLPEEREMLDGVVADLQRGNIGHVLVKDRLGVSVWRTLRSAISRSGTTRSAASRSGTTRSADTRNPIAETQADPSPLAPLPLERGEGSFYSDAVTRCGGPGGRPPAALPRATVVNPSGVLEISRLSSAKKGERK